MNVVVSDLMVNYQKVGDGQKVLLMLHGWGMTAQNFDQLIEKLDGEYTILAPDLPGFGGSQAAPAVWGLDEYADFVKAWLDKLGIKEIYGLVGHSNGGGIAIRAVGRGVLKPQKLVLIAAAGVRDRHKAKRALLKAAAKSGKLVTAPLPAGAQRKIRTRFYRRLGSDAGLYPHMEGTFRKIISQDVQSDAESIKVPTLLIYGTADKKTPALFGEIFHREIQGSKLVIIDGADHFLHNDQVERVAKLTASFLGGK